MPYVRALLSALTFFGGHLLNRRLDRVVLLFAILAAVGITCYLILPTVLFNAGSARSAVWAVRASTVLIVAIAIGSAVLTWMDASEPGDAPLAMGTQVAGGIVSVFGLMILSVALVSLLASRSSTAPPPDGNPSPDDLTVTHYSFHTSTHLGGHPTTSELSRPPEGPHALRGRIVLDGQPVEDAEIQLILNKAFETDTLFTNDHGEFEVALPAGKWFINRVTVTEWDDAPKGRVLLLFSEFEPAKGSGYYTRFDFNDDSGLEINLLESQGSVTPTFELRDAINVEWPSRTGYSTTGRPTVPVADVASSAISWTPVPSATEYEIQLSSIKREDRSTSYETVLRRRQSAARLRLSELPQQPRESPEPGEYAITIFAFDSAGKLLTQTDHRGELAFSLVGDTRLVEEAYASSAAPSDRTEYFRNLERLSLVAGLLDYKQLDAARVILADVTEEAPPGRKVALQGAIEALSGNCKAALPLLERADLEGGAGCAEPKYRRLCEAQ